MLNRSLTSTFDRMITLNRAIDETLAATGAASNGAYRGWAPALDIVEKPEAYLVLVDLPGVERSQVDLSFEKNVLTIRGTKGADVRDPDVRVYAAERVSGKFERTIRLPQFVDGDKISAELVNGLLTVTVPKGHAAQPRKIELSN